MRLLPLLALFACQQSSDDVTGGLVGAPPDTDLVEIVDVDGDGVTADEGDCDDGSPEVYPGALDNVCDGLDGDCDGEIDEDFDLDPNEGSVRDFGHMGTSGEAFTVGYLFPDGDQDTFRFSVDDGDLSWFSIEGFIYGVDPELDVRLDLVYLETGETVASSDEHGAGGYEVLDFGGTAIYDDAGEYELVVSGVHGSTCNTPYTIHILVGGL